MINKMQNRNNMNLEDIMKMNDILKPFQERSKEAGDENFNDKCVDIEIMMIEVDNDSDWLKQFEEDLNKAIELSTNDIFKYFDDSYNEFNPELLVRYKYLKAQIKDQKDENANLLKQIDLLNQEISTIFDNIIKLGNRLDAVEKVCGVDKIEVGEDDDDNYQF